MHLEREEWEAAVGRLERASTVYAELGASTEDAAGKAVYKQRVGEIEPSVRYCRYNAARARGEDVTEDLSKLSAAGDLLKAKVEKSLAEARKQQSDAHGTVQWLGEELHITSAEVNQHLISAEELGDQLAALPAAEALEARLELYDRLLMALEDAKQQIRDEVSALLKAGDEAGRAPALQTLRTYVQAEALLRARDRDLLLVEQLQEKLARRETGRKATRPEDLVGMFETLVQNAEEVAALPGVAEYAPLAKLQAARGLLFKAWRVAFLAASYLEQGQGPEALALAERAQQLGKVAGTRMGEAGVADGRDTEWQARLAALAREKRVEALAAALKAQADRADKPAAARAPESLRQLAQTPLSARMQSYEAAAYGEAGKVPKLVDFPPPIEAVACKPTLFDLALNKVEFPDVAARAQSAAAGGKRGGLLGWFRK
jgi:signal recognition particle subunit SRP68